MARLLPAIAVMAALYLPPAPTAADMRFARLSQPGIVAIVRHAHAPGTGDSTRFMLEECTTQRNLDVRGRERQLSERRTETVLRVARIIADLAVAEPVGAEHVAEAVGFQRVDLDPSCPKPS